MLPVAGAVSFFSEKRKNKKKEIGAPLASCWNSSDPGKKDLLGIIRPSSGSCVCVFPAVLFGLLCNSNPTTDVAFKR